MNFDDHLTALEKQIAKHILYTAREGKVESDLNEDVEWTVNDLTVTAVDVHEHHTEQYVQVEARTEDYTSEQVSRGSRMHPPEYKSYDVDILVTAAADWREHPLCGDIHMTVEQHGGPASPPDPEPYRGL
jgi:hypothetical protein